MPMRYMPMRYVGAKQFVKNRCGGPTEKKNKG